MKQDAGFGSWWRQHFCHMLFVTYGSGVCGISDASFSWRSVCKTRLRLLCGLERVLVCSGWPGCGVVHRAWLPFGFCTGVFGRMQ